MKKTALIILSFFLANHLFANPVHPMKRTPGPAYGFSLAGGSMISFFQTDPRHSEKANPRPGFNGMFRFHYFPDQSIHFHAGLELMTQATSFNTYYFAPNHSVFYDGSFGYTHKLRTVELYIPLLIRVGLTAVEGNARNIFYLLAGYAPKVFLAAS
ncbi:MAG TPA: hypothetical protein VI731_09225, partial [Bacteroidia bacterium]|nr:hypothetical protein [Bacteroidia bacterium]